MSEEKMKEFGEKLRISRMRVTCDKCPLAEECDGNCGSDEKQEKFGELWAEANGYVKADSVPKVNEEFLRKLALALEFNVRPAFFRDAATEDEIEILTEQGIKEQWVEFLRKNLFVDVTKKVEEKVADSAGELDPTPLEVMNSFGFYRHYLAGKVIECVARNDFDRAKEYQSKIKNPPQSVPGLIDVIRNWKLTRSESLFLLDFIKEFACDHEIDQFEEIEVLRYIAEKGALMEDQNVSNDDNR